MKLDAVATTSRDGTLKVRLRECRVIADAEVHNDTSLGSPPRDCEDAGRRIKQHREPVIGARGRSCRNGTEDRGTIRREVDAEPGGLVAGLDRNVGSRWSEHADELHRRVACDCDAPEIAGLAVHAIRSIEAQHDRQRLRRPGGRALDSFNRSRFIILNDAQLRDRWIDEAHTVVRIDERRHQWISRRIDLLYTDDLCGGGETEQDQTEGGQERTHRDTCEERRSRPRAFERVATGAMG
ncbi:MAG TPA: hypothetical protein VNA88_02365 [Candidatus Kapabacteria bacterium]|nr:hypothetical protein [Candidatus Kapabacteria bacterium]